MVQETMTSPNCQNKAPEIDQIVISMSEHSDVEYRTATLGKFNEHQEITET
jgi:hypothetical protein